MLCAGPINVGYSIAVCRWNLEWRRPYHLRVLYRNNNRFVHLSQAWCHHLTKGRMMEDHVDQPNGSVNRKGIDS